ncbi:MAG TPA: signal recognition particle-docking protein FtsY, partial [Actinomycetota bacterium]|nr:signal recognition particle-docking protein FtsY [Actinomycetota bacterium]
AWAAPPAAAPPKPEAPPAEPKAEAPPAVEAPASPPPPAPVSPAPPAPAPPKPEAPGAPTPAPPLEAPPAAEVPLVEEVEEVVEPKKRLRERLFKSRSGFGQALVGVFKRSQLTEEDWEDIEAILLQADVGVNATMKIVEDLRDNAKKVAPDELVGKLRENLLGIIGDGERRMIRKSDGLTVWIVTGVNGTGKTTTIGKLALRLHREGKKVVLAAADTFRAAADEQLQRWAERSGAELVRHQHGADPAAVAFDGVKAAKSRGADVLIVDTAGRLHTKTNLMEELSKIRRVVEREAGAPDEVLLVLDATTGQNGIVQARAFLEAVGVTSVALTKLDGTAKGGIVIAVQQELGLPVKLVGVGETPEDLQDFDPAAFVDALIS